MRDKFWLLLSFMAILVVGFYQLTAQAQRQATPTPTRGMSGMMATPGAFSSVELAPLVGGIYNGEDILFIHTEASDADVARTLTDMMGPTVLTVPSLAQIPEAVSGNVYVFNNGVIGDGPMGFQPDVFDSIPGDEAYTPLRRLNFVTWEAERNPQQLNSIAEIESAENAGDITIQSTDIVINMPILVWPDGHR